MEISVDKRLVKPVLWLTRFFKDRTAVLVCKVYGDDWKLYTGLYWDEDKDLEISDYKDYQLWLNLKRL